MASNFLAISSLLAAVMADTPVRLLRWVGGLRAWLRRGTYQLAQPDEIVGSDSQREYPADTGQTAVTGLAETGDRLGPAEHLLDALTHPPDRIAGVAGRSTVDCRPPVRRVLRDMRRHIVLAQIGDEAGGHIIGLVGTERDRR